MTRCKARAPSFSPAESNIPRFGRSNFKSSRRGTRGEEKERETAVNSVLFSRVTSGVVRKVAVTTIVNPSLPHTLRDTRHKYRNIPHARYTRNTLIGLCSTRASTNGCCKIARGREKDEYTDETGHDLDFPTGKDRDIASVESKFDFLSPDSRPEERRKRQISKIRDK